MCGDIGSGVCYCVSADNLRSRYVKIQARNVRRRTQHSYSGVRLADHTEEFVPLSVLRVLQNCQELIGWACTGPENGLHWRLTEQRTTLFGDDIPRLMACYLHSGRKGFVLVLQQLFCVSPPERGPFPPGSVVGSEPKSIRVKGKTIDGWIVTIQSDENEVHLMFENMDDGE